MSTDLTDSLDAWFTVEEDSMPNFGDPTCLVCGHPTNSGALHCQDCRREREDKQRGLSLSAPKEERPPFPGRVELLLPWAAFASDNLRKGVIGKANRDAHHRYTEALALFRSRIRAQYSGAPCTGPARVDVVFYVPNDRRLDHVNFVKLTCDGLKGIIIEDDCWQVLRDARLMVAGVDRDDPRALITVEAIDGES